MALRAASLSGRASKPGVEIVGRRAAVQGVDQGKSVNVPSSAHTSRLDARRLREYSIEETPMNDETFQPKYPQVPEILTTWSVRSSRRSPKAWPAKRLPSFPAHVTLDIPGLRGQRQVRRRNPNLQ